MMLISFALCAMHAVRERVSVWYSNPVKASSPREVMHYPTPTQVVHTSQGVLRANQLTDLCTTVACTALAGFMVFLKEVHVYGAWYLEQSLKDCNIKVQNIVKTIAALFFFGFFITKLLP